MRSMTASVGWLPLAGGPGSAGSRGDGPAFPPAHYTLRPPSWLRIGEPAPDPLSEADLSRIWEGQRFPAAALATADGRDVRVMHPGRLNNGPGPDFRDAVVAVGGQERRGDVELHVRASAFRAHGHDHDPAYDRVALHVVYLADDGDETRLSDGRLTPVAAFAPWLEKRRADIEAWLSAPALWTEPCRSAEKRLGANAIASVLREAGEARLAARVAAMATLVHQRGEETAIWLALCDALGTGGDRDGFRRLAEAFLPPHASLRNEEADGQSFEAQLLAVAGLGTAPPEIAPLLPPPLRPPLLRMGRPNNWPERRLAALARLWVRAGGDLASHCRSTVRRATDVRKLAAAWEVPGDRGAALLGAERARELVLNVVLPFAATRAELRPRAEELLSQLPPQPAYSKTAFLEANLRRPDGGRPVRSAIEQQGLLGMLAQWCSQGGCGRCPLS